MSIDFSDELTMSMIAGIHTPQSLDDYSSASSPGSFTSSRQCSPGYTTASNGMVGSSEEDAGNRTKTEEKPPVKKRKSWGQQLPTPTTSLPPRKRAKTVEEKEQRRVERVLRNRAAAQKSREIKKQQLEAIETERDVLKAENDKLQMHNQSYQNTIAELRQQLERLSRDNERLRKAREFSTDDLPLSPNSDVDTSLDIFNSSINYTLDPSSLSEPSLATPSDSSCMTHQPAALVCDLPCLQRTTTTAFMPALRMVLEAITKLGSLLWILSLVSRKVAALDAPPPLNHRTLRFLQETSWTSFSAAATTFSKRMTGQICSSVLAHLRIATDCSSQMTKSSTSRSEWPSSLFGLDDFETDNETFGGVMMPGWGGYQSVADRGYEGKDAMVYRHSYSLNWAPGVVLGVNGV